MPLTIPTSLDDITPEWLTAALADGGIPRGANITGYAAETIAAGAGFMSRLFRLRLDYDVAGPDLPGAIIVKLPWSDPDLRAVYARFGQHGREVRFYRELAANPHLPAPRCHHSGIDPITGDTVLLLEDMSGARQGDSVAGCGFDDARLAIVQLARFQASWWDSPALAALEWMPSKAAEAALYQEIHPGAWRSLVEKAGAGMPRGLRQLGNRLGPDVPRIKAELTASPRTVVHGDYRPDNCFFSADAGQHRPVVIDWEFCVRGRGICDVATFITETFPAQQRREAEMELVRTYHAVLLDSGVSDYSFQECWHDYRLAMLELFIFWIVTGGYCAYEGDRATAYLHNTLGRIDAAITELGSLELISGG